MMRYFSMLAASVSIMLLCAAEVEGQRGRGGRGGGFGGGLGAGGGFGGTRTGPVGGGFGTGRTGPIGGSGIPGGGVGGDRTGPVGGGFGTGRTGPIGGGGIPGGGVGGNRTGPVGGGIGTGRTGPVGNGGLARYSAAGGVGVGHRTAYWSQSHIATRSTAVRTSFAYHNCFRPGWYVDHPGAWVAARWAVGAAWTAASWASVSSYCGVEGEPLDYSYGDQIVYQDDQVLVDGQSAGTPQEYAQQATALADQGLQAKVNPDDDWKPLGVFALAQGDETTSNNIFQLAINKDGILRGNYYDGLTDTTTEVAGSLKKSSQRIAWTIGKKKDRVFEAGLSSLTEPEAPVLVHIGTDNTQQMLLVRMEEPKDGK